MQQLYNQDWRAQPPANGRNLCTHLLIQGLHQCAMAVFVVTNLPVFQGMKSKSADTLAKQFLLCWNACQKFNSSPFRQQETKCFQSGMLQVTKSKRPWQLCLDATSAFSSCCLVIATNVAHCLPHMSETSITSENASGKLRAKTKPSVLNFPYFPLGFTTLLWGGFVCLLAFAPW